MSKRFRLLSLALMLFAALGLNAQVTTSALAGIVTDETNQTMVGATVQAVHTPSGTKYNAVTNTDGRYFIQGMRTGGPYTVSVTYVGYEPKNIDGIVLELGETYDLDVNMNYTSNQLSEVVVQAIGTKFTTEKTGASTNISNSQITAMPSVTRGIGDFTRLSPYGGREFNFAGSDGRYANFTVDGANFNNNFGLTSALPGGGNPISIEAIEEMQVVISPFDVRQTNFVSGGVNAITKSGNNTFKGSAYFYHRNENMRGDAVDRVQIGQAREKDRVSTYGFTLSGPIVKDKLFFFVNGEMLKKPTIVNTYVASENGFALPDQHISRTSLADLKTVSDFVREKYGYNTGSYTNFPADENNYKILARLDWNINEMHHIAFRYNYTKNRYWNMPNARSMDGGTRMSNARISASSFSFANSMYSQDNLVHSFSLDFNSRLSDNLSNQLLLTFSKFDDVRGSNSSEFPFIDITKTDDKGVRDNYMSLGYELFTWNNGVHNRVWTLKDDITYTRGTHKLLAGLSFEHQMADNAYQRNGTGYYRYYSLNDFLTGAAPEIVALTYGYGGEKNPAARIRYNKVGIYAQDEWNIAPRFKLTYGLRLDGLFFNNADLKTNKAILDIDYSGIHIDTGKWPSSKVIFQPRVGFVYDIRGDKSLKFRGGTGLFSGRLPLVFFTNMPSNSGMVQYAAALSGTELMKNFTGGLVTDANGKPTIAALRDKLISMGYPADIKPEDGAKQSSIAAVDPKYKMPLVWKSTLALDYTIPVSFPFTATIEGVFNKTVNGSQVIDVSMKDINTFDRFVGPDNRPIYPKGFRTDTKAFMLTNTSKGYGWSANITLNAKPASWISLMAAYTHTVSKEISSLPGNNAESAFTYVPTIDGPNHIKLHNSQFVTPDRFIFSATGHDRSGNHYGLIYEAYRGSYAYSYVTTNDMNGDGYNYDLIYIPTDDEVANGTFRFTSDDDRTRFMDYVHNNDYLSKRQGKYTEAYNVFNPWVHRIDLSYKHDFNFRIGSTKHTLQLSFDIKNVLNLFSSKWGVTKYVNPEFGTSDWSGAMARILKYDGVGADGVPVYSTPTAINGNTQTFVRNKAIGETWNASIGIKYIFN